MRNVNFVEKFLILMDKNNFLGGKHLLLASASPRRRELLSQLNVEVVQAPLKKVDENYPASLDVHLFPEKKRMPIWASWVPTIFLSLPTPWL